MNRRGFLHRSAAAGAALILPRAARGANERIRVAHIGVGGLGNAHVRWFAAQPDTDIVALCDVDRVHLDDTLKRLAELRPEGKADGYADYRPILDRDDVDVITCATPDHWHALIACDAFAAGKDVYGEKPLSRTKGEADAMRRLARRQGRIFQLGTQIHAGENYHRCVELLRSGALGRIHTVHLWKASGPANMPFTPDADPPPELDWDRWLGPAPQRPYNPSRCHRSFRSFWDYSGGVFADFWCHLADLVFWALSPGQPKTVEATGRTVGQGMAETPWGVEARYTFDGLELFWHSRRPSAPGTVGGDLGLWFIGENGSLVTDYSQRELFLGGERVVDLPEVPRSLTRSPGHQRQFLDSVKSRRPPGSNIEFAHTMTLPLYLGLIACRLGRPLAWDGRRQRFVDDPAADRLLLPAYRAPWRLP